MPIKTGGHVLFGDTWNLDKCGKLQVFENEVLSRIFGPKSDEGSREGRR
jgi:hypothetical protein